ncbi:MAG: endolytic transglycosylase MltG [Ignavibacteria bacterium]
MTKRLTGKVLEFFKKSGDIHNRFSLVFKRNPLTKSLLILICFFVLWGSVSWWLFYSIVYGKNEFKELEEIQYILLPGKNADQVINELVELKVIQHKIFFKLLVKFSGKEGNLISGKYVFRSGIRNIDVLHMLTDKNLLKYEKFTVYEGATLKYIGKLVETKLKLSSEKFLSECKNDSLLNILGLKGKVETLEGFLFPETYFLPLDITESGLVTILFNEFLKRVYNNIEIKNGLQSKNKNLLEIITLASIIQGETTEKDEMPIIAGVYYNRLKKGMKLEADPTVQYVIPDGPKPRLTLQDLKYDSPYNTYRHYGLPPAPINNPGLDAIKAALNPQEHNYYFFVAIGQGRHKFSETYEEHLKTIEEIKKSSNTE